MLKAKLPTRSIPWYSIKQERSQANLGSTSIGMGNDNADKQILLLSRCSPGREMAAAYLASEGVKLCLLRDRIVGGSGMVDGNTYIAGSKKMMDDYGIEPMHNSSSA